MKGRLKLLEELLVVAVTVSVGRGKRTRRLGVSKEESTTWFTPSVDASTRRACCGLISTLSVECLTERCVFSQMSIKCYDVVSTDPLQHCS